MNKERNIKLVLIVSMAILALVMLITSSIHMDFVNNPFSGSAKTSAIVSLIMVVAGVIILGVSAFLMYKKSDLGKGCYLLMVLTLLLFIIAFAIVGEEQNSYYQAYTLLDNTKGIPAKMLNGMRLFPVNLSFILLMGVPFVGASIFYVRDEFL